MKSLKQLKAKRLLAKFEMEETFKTETLDSGFQKRIFFRENNIVHIAVIKILENDVEIVYFSSALGGCPKSQLRRMTEYLKIANDTYNDRIKLMPPDVSNGNVRIQTTMPLSKLKISIDFSIAILGLQIRAFMFEDAIHKIAEGQLLKKSDYPDEVLEYEKKLVNEYVTELFGEEGK